MQVDFYQLGQSPLARVLAQVAGKVVAGGGRLLVVTGDPGQAAALDEALWDGADSFLPHGRATPDDPGADQPVLIAADCAAAGDARNVAIADGVWRDEALAFDRVFHFFDASSIDAARAAWRALGSREAARNFWTQDGEGRWRKTA